MVLTLALDFGAAFVSLTAALDVGVVSALRTVALDVKAALALLMAMLGACVARGAVIAMDILAEPFAIALVVVQSNRTPIVVHAKMSFIVHSYSWQPLPTRPARR